MREIFANKEGCRIGTVYEKNGLKYCVVSSKRPTYFSLTQNGVTQSYYENENNIYQADEDFLSYSDTPLSESEHLELTKKVKNIVYDKAYAIGLSGENASTASDALIETLELHLAANPGQNANEALTTIRAASQTQTQNLLPHQREAFETFELSLEQASVISLAQLDHLTNLFEDETDEDLNDSNPAEEFERIRNLREFYQLNVFLCGLSSEQAETISEEMSNYLCQFSENAEIAPKLVQDEFQRLQALSPNDLAEILAQDFEQEDDVSVISPTALDQSFLLSSEDELSDAQEEFDSPTPPASQSPNLETFSPHLPPPITEPSSSSRINTAKRDREETESGNSSKNPS